MGFEIHHSGQTFVSLGHGRFGPIWPVEELFARRKFGASVRARIRKLSGGALEEGSLIPGWHPKPMSWRRAKTLMRRGIDPKRTFRLKGGREWHWFSSGPHPVLLQAQGIY